jgi:hypothetical protein
VCQQLSKCSDFHCLNLLVFACRPNRPAIVDQRCVRKSVFWKIGGELGGKGCMRFVLKEIGVPVFRLQIALAFDTLCGISEFLEMLHYLW